MICVANRIYVAPEFVEQFETNFTNRAGLVDGMPGFVFNQLFRPTAAGDPYVVFTMWKSRAAFDAWVKSDAFVQGHARSRTLPREAFSQPSHVEVHELILDSREPGLVPEPHGAPLSVHRG